MREHDPLTVVRFKDKDAGFYWRRFINGTQLIMAIDDGAYGNINWWAGSPQAEEDGSVTQLLPVNIGERAEIRNEMTGQRQRGLRFAVQRGAVWGSYRWLMSNGYGDEVKTMLEHVRNPGGLKKAA